MVTTDALVFNPTTFEDIAKSNFFDGDGNLLEKHDGTLGFALEKLEDKLAYTADFLKSHVLGMVSEIRDDEPFFGDEPLTCRYIQVLSKSEPGDVVTFFFLVVNTHAATGYCLISYSEDNYQIYELPENLTEAYLKAQHIEI